jgi:peptidoglycan-N-acetylmuramic acid deacetylase
MSAMTQSVLRVALTGLTLDLLFFGGFALGACGGTAEPSSPAPGPSVTQASSPSATASPSSASPSPSRTASRSPSATPSASRTATPTALPTCPTDNTVRSWFYVPNDAHRVPEIPADARRLLRAYSARYVGDTSDKVVYLTFDEGYENGFTGRILGELHEAGVTAAFFVTGDYVRDNPGLVRRMADEGHVVGNHTDGHPSLPSLAGDAAAFAQELSAVTKAYRRVTGGDLARVLRPPMGDYSARSLCLARRLGYTTVFWSFAHRDWLTDDQPPVKTTVKRALAESHKGAIYLLHAVSRSNTEALPAIIAGLRAQGYRIASPAELL